MFALPGKAEAGSAGEQPARNTLVHENEPANVPVSLLHSFALSLINPITLLFVNCSRLNIPFLRPFL